MRKTNTERNNKKPAYSSCKYNVSVKTLEKNSYITIKILYYSFRYKNVLTIILIYSMRISTLTNNHTNKINYEIILR